MRHRVIDFLRSLAIASMVFVHFSENLANVSPPFAGMGAPLFAFLSGVSYRLWLNSRQRRGVSELEITKATVRRGLFLIGLGFLFNILVWLPGDTFNWDVLTFIGCGWISLLLVRRWPVSVVVVATITVMAISPVARSLVAYPEYWSNGYFECDLSLSEVLIGWLVAGYFPLLPWIIFPWIGFAIGSSVFGAAARAGHPHAALRVGTALVAVAAILVLLAKLFDREQAWSVFAAWHMFPPSIAYICSTLGCATLALVLLPRCFERCDAWPWSSKAHALLASLSRHALTLYLLHHVVHLWPLWILATARGLEPTVYWRQAMSAPIALSLAAMFLVGSCWLVRWMDRRKVRGVEDWMRWLCD